MSFKLGRERGLQASNGEIKSKLRFKREGPSIPGTPIIKKDLAPGIMGEANMDGSIYISNKLEPDSEQERQTVAHEMRHATDIKIGKLEYADNYIKYNGEKFTRETIDGKDMIFIDGKWKEAGHHGFPWEVDANNGN
jgi:hypothetical protein